jgi:hypothetical protein
MVVVVELKKENAELDLEDESPPGESEPVVCMMRRRRTWRQARGEIRIESKSDRVFSLHFFPTRGPSFSPLDYIQILDNTINTIAAYQAHPSTPSALDGHPWRLTIINILSNRLHIFTVGIDGRRNPVFQINKTLFTTIPFIHDRQTL